MGYPIYDDMESIKNILKSRIGIGIILLGIGLVVGYKNAPKPVVETKIEYRDVEVIKYVQRDVVKYVDRIIKPDGTIIEKEVEVDKSIGLDKSKDSSYSYTEKKMIDKNYLLSLDKEMIRGEGWSVGGGYKVYANDKMDVFLKGDIGLDGKSGRVGIGIGF